MTARPLGLGALATILVFSGFMNALQARANGELTRHVGNGVQAAFISFATGLVMLSFVLVIAPSVRAGVARIPAGVKAQDLAWWALPGGLLGGAFIACQSYSTALVGVALFSVGMVAGQTINSLIVDRVGLSPIGKSPITARRVASSVLAIAAVVLSVSGASGGATVSVVALLAAFLGGCLVAVQQALNGRVNVVSRQPIATTWLNFVFGTFGLTLGVAFGVAVSGASLHLPTSGPFWMYLGGLFGLIFIVTAAWAVPRYGVLVFALVTIAGQLSAALVLDVLAPVGDNRVKWQLLAGVLVTYLAVGVGAMRRR
jgi:transporter family-2 protein